MIASLKLPMKQQPCCKERSKRGFFSLKKKTPPVPVSTTITPVDRSIAKCDTIVGGRCVPFQSTEVKRLKRLRKMWHTLAPVDESAMGLCEECLDRRFCEASANVTVLVTDIALTYYKPPLATAWVA
ncbi:unnamed protein product [Aphanomyces euteiches]|uniref:Uncharacterized protein n=1 Tax=Aphanomyces euteiches TaxID=100861 RepID=A0A6G0W4B9_9STRA|nr:hypothetical protein Ae201684_018851 [Aphanomyces euteiches]KAH9073651.1 hypothetical protein Ae201684P_003155 [Aphanomyces euteiches]